MSYCRSPHAQRLSGRRASPDDRRQLFRFELSAVLVLAAGRGGRLLHRAPASGATGNPARRLFPHSLLPKALPLLLLPRLHRQGLRGDQAATSTRRSKEFELYARQPLIGGRKPKFVYFGGGTPSYLSVDQLQQLTDGMKALLPWDEAEEVTFECEPGHAHGTQAQSHPRDGRHAPQPRRREFRRSHPGDQRPRPQHRRKSSAPTATRATSASRRSTSISSPAWSRRPRRTGATASARPSSCSPDSVTIYQMEIPYNTTIYKEMKAEGKLVAPVADWEHEARLGRLRVRRIGKSWLHRRQRLHRGEGQSENAFVYRDKLWAGADLLALGVACFGHIGGTHYQNHHDFEPYVDAVNAGELPDLSRADADRGRTTDSRIHPAAQARAGQPEYFRKKIWRRLRETVSPSRCSAFRDWGFAEIDGTHDQDESRRAAPSRPAPARVFPAGAPTMPRYCLNRSRLCCQPLADFYAASRAACGPLR